MWLEALTSGSAPTPSNIYAQTIVIDNRDAHLAQASLQEIIFDNIPVNSDIILLEIDGYNSNNTYNFHQSFSPWLSQAKYGYRYINAGSETLGFDTFGGSSIANKSWYCPLGSINADTGKWTLTFKLPNQSTRFKSLLTFIVYYSPK